MEYIYAERFAEQDSIVNEYMDDNKAVLLSEEFRAGYLKLREDLLKDYREHYDREDTFLGAVFHSYYSLKCEARKNGSCPKEVGSAIIHLENQLIHSYMEKGGYNLIKSTWKKTVS